MPRRRWTILASASERRAILATLCVLAMTVLGAQQGDPVPAPSRTIRFTVQVSPDDLTVDQVPIPNEQAFISRVSLRPGSSPVGYTQNPGLPRLPFLTRSLALPPGAKLVTVEATPVKSMPIGGAAPLVSWSQPARGTQGNGLHEPVYSPGPDPFYPQLSYVPLDPAVLQSKAWPPTLVAADSPADALGFQLLTMRISPVQWLPSAEQLVLHTEIAISVTFQGGAPTQPGSGFAEAMQLNTLRARIVNPEDVPPLPVPDTPLPADVWYLVITDDFYWDSDITIGAPVPGGLVSEFQRLADWKTRKGIKSGVVRISDIVHGTYGDFTTGARDLQEVIRNFLKFATREWNTYWVLLGGDVEVVPVRQVVGTEGPSNYGYVLESDPDSEQPAAGKSRWHADSATRRIHQAGGIDASTVITNPWTGVAYRRVAAPSTTNPGWAFVTSDTYTDETVTRTDFIVLRGEVEDVSGMFPVAALKENSIPTDFYYTSLRSAVYDQPGLHDWDANDNGVYGQHTGSSSSDGVHWSATLYDEVNFFANIALGRAPVKNGDDARVFVDKVVAYERDPAPPTSTFGRRVLFAASDWDDSAPAVSRSRDRCDELEPGDLCRPARVERPTLWRMRFGSVRALDSDWRLLVFYFSGPRTLRYNPALHADGWRYCTNAFCEETSQAPATPEPGAPILPMPTEWVEADPGEVGISAFAFDGVGPDQSVRDKEHVRWELSWLAPGLDERTRLFQDLVDTPLDPAVPTHVLKDRAVTAYISLGANVVSLTGHGLPSGCCGLWTSLVDQYVNGVMGGVAFADSCSTNAFDEDRTISEALLTSPVGGLAAYVGNTRYGWIGYGANYEQLFWSRLPFTRHVGELLNSKVVYAHDSPDYWSIFSLNLLGDPEMSIWLGRPDAFAVEHPAHARDGSLFAVGVRATDGTPLPSSRVTIVFADGTMQSGLTDLLGQHAFRARGADGDRLRVTVTRTDYRPYLGEIIVDVPVHFDRPLISGTNYVSTPVVPIDASIDSLFKSIAAAVAGISTWDRASQRFLIWSPGGLNNTLSRIEAGRGYEVRMRTPATLALDGEPSSAPVAVLPGLNEVGFNSLTPLAVGQALGSLRGAYAAIYTWDQAARQFRWYFPGLPGLSTLTMLQPGVGYVILATKPATWLLPASPPQ